MPWLTMTEHKRPCKPGEYELFVWKKKESVVDVGRDECAVGLISVIGESLRHA
jgi:hypothetical protein